MFHKFLVVFCMIALPFATMASSRIPVSITSQGKVHQFQLESAFTPKSQEHGLMFRTELPQDGGMLFHYGTARQVYMWMRNTLIPLDMLFVKPNGSIAHIVENAAPHSEEPRGTLIPVSAVLELPGGTVKRLGIAVGDHVRYAAPDSP